MAKKSGHKLLLTVECEVLPDELSTTCKGALKVEVESKRTNPYKVTVSCCAPAGFLKLSGQRSYCSRPVVVFPKDRQDTKWEIGVSHACPSQAHQLHVVAEANRLVALPPNYPRGGVRAVLDHGEFASISDRIEIAMDVIVK